MNRILMRWLTVVMVFLSISFSVNSYADQQGSTCQISKKPTPYMRNNNSLFLESITATGCVAVDKPKYPDILLVHGLTYSSHQFDLHYKDYSLALFLAKHGFRVWLLDITGYGRSQKVSNGFMVNGDYAAQDIDGAIKLIRKVQQVDKVNLLGWSFGTISSSRMVKIHPNWVNSLILYAPIYHGLGLAAPTLDYQPFTTAAALSDFQKDAHTQQIITAIAESAVVNQYLAQCRQYDGAGSVNGCRKDLFESSSVTLFDPRAITMPTLLVAGTKDPYINWESDIPYLVKTMPNPKNRVIKIVGASHVLMLEQPYYHLFQQDVLKFLLENN